MSMAAFCHWNDASSNTSVKETGATVTSSVLPLSCIAVTRAHDGAGGYWVNHGDNPTNGSVMAGSLSGGTPATLKAGGTPTAVAVDATSVYVAYDTGAIVKITPK